MRIIWTDGWMDGWMDGKNNGPTDHTHIQVICGNVVYVVMY